MRPQKVLVVVGPTSSGKSALAVELARRFDGEVISADSRQIYRGLDLAAGKITKREMKGVPHHLLGVALPRKTMTARDFTVLGRAAISEIAARGKLPIVCGGTGLYIDALLGRVALPDVPADEKLRARLEKKSAARLFAMLEKRDPRRAGALSSQSERNNKRRLIRAIEIAEPSVRPGKNMGFVNPYFDAAWIGLCVPMRALQKKIADRLRARIRRGMIAEARRLHVRGLSYKRMRELGLECRSLARLLRKKITREEMIEELNHAIRRYAKRQITYWRRNGDIRWFSSPKNPAIPQTVRTWLER